MNIVRPTLEQLDRAAFNTRDRDLPYQQGFRAIHIAAKLGNVAEIHELLRMGASPNSVTHEGTRPIHLAVISGNLEAVQVLIAAGALLEAKTPNRTALLTALHIAVLRGNAPIVRALIDAGADLNALDGRMIPEPETSHHLVKYFRFAEENNFKSFLKPNKSGIDSLSIAVLEGHDEIAQILIAARANVKLKFYKLFKAAVHMSNLETCKRILEAAPGLLGKDLADPADDPLLSASLKGRVDVVELLLRSGEKAHKCIKDSTVLHMVAKSIIDEPYFTTPEPSRVRSIENRVQVVCLLLRHGATLPADLHTRLGFSSPLRTRIIGRDAFTARSEVPAALVAPRQTDLAPTESTTVLTFAGILRRFDEAIAHPVLPPPARPGGRLLSLYRESLAPAAAADAGAAAGTGLDI